MALAGVVIGSVALFLSVFASIVALYQLQHYWRFRKPVFKIESAEFGVRRHEVPGKPQLAFLTDGNLVLNVRGASRAMSLSHYTVTYPDPRVAGAVGGGFGAGSPRLKAKPSGLDVVETPYIVELPAETWKRLDLEVAMGAPLVDWQDEGGDMEPPKYVELGLHFESPEERFPRIPIPLRRSGDEKYTLLASDRERKQMLELYSQRVGISRRLWRRTRRLLRSLVRLGRS